MKKAIVSLFVIAAMAAAFAVNSDAVSPVPENSAESIIIMDADSGTVLFENNSEEKTLIASTTKMMTALVVLENCSWDEEVKIKKEYTNIEGSSIYLKTGEVFTVKELLYGLMLASGNDAAVALACHTAGSIEDFAKLMNERASALGLNNTAFKNPHGLDEEGHYSTARDLAEIARAAIKNEKFREIVSTKCIAVHERVLANHNKLLWKYDGTIGIKTGYTMKSGRSLVSCVERDGTTLIIVTINDRNDWNDHMALYDWGFENFSKKRVVDAKNTVYSVPVISGVNETVSVCAETDVDILLSAEDEYEVKVYLPRFVFAPVSVGDAIGRIDVFLNGEQIGETSLICTEDIQLDKENTLNFWQRSIRNLALLFGD